LKSLESNVLGFDRDTDIPGSEVAACYSHFLRTGDEEALGMIVDHNYWDVISMAALVGLYGEPIEMLHAEDLLGVAGTLKRSRAFDAADDVVEAALRRGVGGAAWKLRGQIAKARGDKANALLHFEAALGKLDDPEVCLELSKLYEHHVKDAGRALEMVARGTLESEESREKRRARLTKKRAKQTARPETTSKKGS
jgi:hypothetical protein